MKIAFLYSSWVIGSRPIVEKKLLTSKRGLTGSELSCFMFCEKMRKRGHDAQLFWGGVPAAARHDEWDIAYAWVDPAPLGDVRATLRMLNQQCNDFNYLHPGFSKAIDVFTSPSEPHRDYLVDLWPETAGKWEIVPNGCDPSQYTAAKVPGRVLYASSPDRGLHLLLQCWPEIKRRVPQAHLRVLYELESWAKGLRDNKWPDPGIQECGQRARYIELALARMKHLDVTAVGSVSRQDMAREMAEAHVLAYPCDTVRFTEGWSVTTLEACAAGAVPVIFGVDSLQHIYGELPSCLPEKDLPRFVNTVEAALTSKFAEECMAVGKQIAARYEWDVLAERLERIMVKHLTPLSRTGGYGETSRTDGDPPEPLPVG